MATKVPNAFIDKILEHKAKFVSIRYYKNSNDIISLPNYLKGIINNIIKRQKEEVML